MLHKNHPNINLKAYLTLRMTQSISLISNNIKRLRELKKLSQKEVAAASGIPQGQYSRIENGKVEPSISSLDKLAAVFEVALSEFFINVDLQHELNLPLMEKIKIIDSLGSEEKNALLKIIDLAIANKRMKDNLSSLIAS